METAMAASFTWKSAQAGNWSTSANWTPGSVLPPGAAGGDTATINATGASYTITYDEAAETLNLLTMNSAAATLSFNANDQLTVNQGTTLTAGTIDLLNSGAILKAGTLATTSGSTINIGSGATLTDNGATVGGVILLNSGATLNNNGTLTTASGSTINMGSGATIKDSGSITVGGVVDMTGTTAFGATNQSIALNGLIEATGGTGTVNFSDTKGNGTLEANGATLLVTGPLSSSTLQSVISSPAASVFETTGPLFFGSRVSFTFLGALGEFQDKDTQSNVISNTVGLNAGSSTTAPVEQR
jgi:fibronectin-binding autotransporter adhesin